MATTINKDDVVLEKIFKNVNDWLSFAEKKNATVLSVFGFITLFSVFGFVKDFESANHAVIVGCCIYLLSYIVVLVSSIASLMPVTKMKDKLIKGDKEKKIKSTDNLWFYGDIIKYNIDEYKKALDDNGVGSFSNIYEQLIPQIIINAHIASKKYTCFKVSSYSIVLGVIAFVICFIASLFVSINPIA
jgi:hypothetical protein